MRLFPIELEVLRQPAPECPQTLEQLHAGRFSGNTEGIRTREMKLNLVPLLQFQRLDQGGRQADGQAIAPL
jgi:hypothetical protein